MLLLGPKKGLTIIASENVDTGHCGAPRGGSNGATPPKPPPWEPPGVHLRHGHCHPCSVVRASNRTRATREGHGWQLWGLMVLQYIAMRLLAAANTEVGIWAIVEGQICVLVVITRLRGLLIWVQRFLSWRWWWMQVRFTAIPSFLWAMCTSFPGLCFVVYGC